MWGASSRQQDLCLEVWGAGRRGQKGGKCERVHLSDTQTTLSNWQVCLQPLDIWDVRVGNLAQSRPESCIKRRETEMVNRWRAPQQMLNPRCAEWYPEQQQRILGVEQWQPAHCSGKLRTTIWPSVIQHEPVKQRGAKKGSVSHANRYKWAQIWISNDSIRMGNNFTLARIWLETHLSSIIQHALDISTDSTLMACQSEVIHVPQCKVRL